MPSSLRSARLFTPFSSARLRMDPGVIRPLLLSLPYLGRRFHAVIEFSPCFWPQDAELVQALSQTDRVTPQSHSVVVVRMISGDRWALVSVGLVAAGLSGCEAEAPTDESTGVEGLDAGVQLRNGNVKEDRSSTLDADLPQGEEPELTSRQGDAGPKQVATVDEAGNLSAPKAVSVPTNVLHNLDPAGETDCFEFSVPSGQRLVVETSDGADGCPGDTMISLYASGETEATNRLALDDDGGEGVCSRLDEIRPAGDYIVCVAEFGAGSEVMRDLVTSITVTELPVDEAGDRSAPKPVVLPAAEAHNIDPAGDIDCFSFTTTEEQTLFVETSNGAQGCPGDTLVALYSGATTIGNSLASNDDDGVGFCSLLESVQPAGEYVVCVDHAFSPGSQIPGLTTTIVAEAPPVDEAGELANPKNVSLPVVEPHNIVPAGESDCFAFSTTEARTLTIRTTEGVDGCSDETRISLHETDSAEEVLLRSSSGLGACSVLETVQPSGDYVACIAHSEQPPLEVLGLNTSISVQEPAASSFAFGSVSAIEGTVLNPQIRIEDVVGFLEVSTIRLEVGGNSYPVNATVGSAISITITQLEYEALAAAADKSGTVSFRDDNDGLQKRVAFTYIVQ